MSIIVIRLRDGELEDYKKQVAQLKRYISDTEEGSRSTEAWRREVEGLKTKLRRTEKEREEAKSVSHLLTVRLNSLNKVMALQDQEISKVSLCKYIQLSGIHSALLFTKCLVISERSLLSR